MEAQRRAEILLKKYSKEYNREVVNGMITMYRKEDNIERLNHWNEIALILKAKYNEKNI
jgi:NAD(P)H-nitrite reductase large subunit